MASRRTTTVRLRSRTWKDLESLRAELADSWLSECAGTQSEAVSLVMAHGIAAVRHSIANPTDGGGVVEDETVSGCGVPLSTRIPADLHERLEQVGERMIAAGMLDGDRRSARGKPPTPRAVATRRALALGFDIIEAKLRGEDELGERDDFDAIIDADFDSEAAVETAVVRWLRSQGGQPERQVRMRDGGIADIVCGPNVIEVKLSSSRRDVYTAIGQAVSYARGVAWPWVAVPSPDGDVRAVMRSAGVGGIDATTMEVFVRPRAPDSHLRGEVISWLERVANCADCAFYEMLQDREREAQDSVSRAAAMVRSALIEFLDTSPSHGWPGWGD